eukprot:gnl/MRDRNA2_/MRDRNA2_125413_c0_seq1.p1 gnl/MRDRNA2_/MRDRNA2_125413_c0~~gnl/MRDRNA2_/MRDRNA2_125413_c0_seq1.p1  ORF type:complete len:356 (-),score=97.32 gnl/MRDRNA2_/MRDRNA2_125413_c0_seq1:92-1159(-)
MALRAPIPPKACAGRPRDGWAHITGGGAASALRLLACGTAEAIHRTAEAGGVRTVLNIMAEARLDADVQSQGCVALGNAIHAGSSTGVSHVEMVSAVLTAMDCHRGEAWVLRQACWTICQLAPGLHTDPECSSEVLAEVGIVHRIMIAMQQHGRNAGLQKMSFRALAGLSTGGFSSLMDEGIVGLVIAAMRFHPEEPSLQSAGCEVLESLMKLIEGLDVKFVSGDGVEAIVAAMRQHPDDAEVQRSACSSLAAVSWADGAHVRAEAAAGAVEASVQALLSHPQQPETQAAAVKMLRRIIAEAPDHGVSAVRRLVVLPRGYAALAHSAAVLHFNKDSKWLLTKMPQNASMANPPVA